MPAGKVRPVAGLAQADHFGRDVLLTDEALSDGPVAARWPRSPIAWCSVADLETMNLLASDHVGENVRRRAETVTPLRSRDGEREEAFSVSWHSPGGDLRWLSPRIPSQEGADTAAEVLASFTHSVLAR